MKQRTISAVILLIIMIGTNLMSITKIKVADYLPAILFAPIIYNIILLFDKILDSDKIK